MKTKANKQNKQSKRFPRKKKQQSKLVESYQKLSCKSHLEN